jgi:hypothetical protein
MSAALHPSVAVQPLHDELIFEATITLRDALQRLEAVRAVSLHRPSDAVAQRRSAGLLLSAAMELLHRAEATAQSARVGVGR